MADMTSALRVIGYVRVSTDKQAESGLGLEDQRQKIEAEIKRRGWELVAMIVDDGVSAKTINRPGLQKALQALADGEADVLMSSKLDRLSRSVSDVCQIGDMAKFYAWSLVLLDVAIDTTTPYGTAQLNMMATFAQLERELIGLRTREALAVLKSQGIRLGRPTLIDSDVETMIAEYRAEGLSMAKIADQLNAQDVPTANGGAKWYASTVKVVLDRAA
jgi:DNA invertase Pin-like site-specific DNA recombinase